MKRTLAFFILFFSIPAFAEISGNLTFGGYNATTGLLGYTVYVCNVTANCLGYTCFQDYDGTSNGTSSGWCYDTATTTCFHNNTVFASGVTICNTNVTYRTCSSGVWSSSVACSSGQTCTPVDSAGSCAAVSSSSSSSSSDVTVNINPLIIFSSFPADFDIVQGTSVSKTFISRNDGNQTLHNISLSVFGISWYNATPSRVNKTAKSEEASFIVNFTAPADADVRIYTVTVTAASHNASVSKALKISVMPNNQTLEATVVPDYSNYTSILQELESFAADLERRGVDVTGARTLLLNARNKLSQAGNFVEKMDYSSAMNLVDEAGGLLDIARAEIEELKQVNPPEFKIDAFAAGAVAVAVGIVLLVAYMLEPPKEDKPKNIYDKVRAMQKTSLFRRGKKSGKKKP